MAKSKTIYFTLHKKYEKYAKNYSHAIIDYENNLITYYSNWNSSYNKTEEYNGQFED